MEYQSIWRPYFIKIKIKEQVKEQRTIGRKLNYFDKNSQIKKI